MTFSWIKQENQTCYCIEHIPVSGDSNMISTGTCLLNKHKQLNVLDIC